MGGKPGKCLRREVWYGCPFQEATLSSDLSGVSGVSVVLNTSFDGASGRGICGYTYSFDALETTKSHIAAFCA